MAIDHAHMIRIFEEACELQPDERVTYLNRVCENNHELRKLIDSLLAADADSEYDEALFGGGAQILADAMAEHGDFEEPEPPIPDQIGNYRVLGVLGHGGMGVVYEAEQISPRRRVALKVVRTSMVTRNLLQRFRHESQVLGLLHHPGIAQIYEAGTADADGVRQPFFAMELVEGETILKHADSHSLDTPARLDLLARLCDIIHYAHQKGVIHRDLKPGNILVTDEAPSSGDREHPATGATSRLKVLDFGIARITDIDLQTVTIQTGLGQLVGTVPYMSPEQASGDPNQIDTRSDVYALGLIACELLSGKLPYDVRGKLVHEAVRIIQEDDPSSLSTANPALRGEIETIVFKAIEKSKDRRYQSAAEFAADIRRFLRNEPIEARPASAWYQTRKFARRNRALVAGVLATLAVSLIGTAVASRYAVVASRYAASDSARADAMERASYISGIAAAMSAAEHHDLVAAAAYLDKTPPTFRGWEYQYIQAQFDAHLAEWTTPSRIITPVWRDSHSRQMSAISLDLEILTWGGDGGSPLSTFPLAPDADPPLNPNRPIRIHVPTGRYAAIDMADNLVIGSIKGDFPAHVIRTGVNPVASPISWDDSGERLIFHDGHTQVWADNSLSELAERAASQATFSHSGDRIVLTIKDEIKLLDPMSGDTLARQIFKDVFTQLVFSPDDRLIVATGLYRNVVLFDAFTLEIVADLGGHQGPVGAAAWSEDGTRIATVSNDGTLRIWDRDADTPVAVHLTEIGDVEPHVTIQGDDVLVAGDRLQRFPLHDPAVLRDHESYVYNLAFSPDGSMIASSGYLESELRLWDVESRVLRARLPAPKTFSQSHSTAAAPNVQFSSDSTRLVASTIDNTWQWDTNTLEPLQASASDDPFEQFLLTLGRRHSARYTPYAVLGPVEDMLPDDLLGGPPIYQAWGVDVSRDGTRIAMTQEDGTTSVYRAGSNTPIGSLVGHTGIVHCAAFSPDGSRLATGGNDNTVRIWNAHTFEQLLVLRGHTSYVKAIEFSPDGTILASASGDRTIRLWDASKR